MNRSQTASSCRWAVPTIFVAGPTWTDAADRPWTCSRTPGPGELESTDICRTGAYWNARPGTTSPGTSAETPELPAYFLDILSNQP